MKKVVNATVNNRWGTAVRHDWDARTAAREHA